MGVRSLKTLVILLLLAGLANASGPAFLDSLGYFVKHDSGYVLPPRVSNYVLEGGTDSERHLRVNDLKARTCLYPEELQEGLASQVYRMAARYRNQGWVEAEIEALNFLLAYLPGRPGKKDFLIHFHLGNAYSKQGNMPLALRHMQYSVNLQELEAEDLTFACDQLPAGEEDVRTCLFLAKCYNGLANQYFLSGNPDSALVCSRAALAIRESRNKKSRKWGIALQTHAQILLQTEKRDEARAALLKAIDIFLSDSSKAGIAGAPVYLAETYLSLAEVERIADFRLAFRLIARSDSCARAFYGKTPHRDYAKLLCNQAALLNRMATQMDFSQAYQLSKEKSQEALKILVPGFEPDSIQQNPVPDRYSNDPWIMVALGLKGEALSGRTSSGNYDRLDWALDAFEGAYLQMDRLRARLGSQGAKSKVSQSSIRLTEHAIGTALALYEQTRSPEYFEAAFRFAERSKSILLLSGLRGRNQNNEWTRKERKLIYRLGELQAKKSQLASSGKQIPQGLSLEIMDLERKLDLLMARIQVTDFNHYKERYASSVASLDEVRAGLPDENAALLEYFVGEEQVYVFCIRKDKRGDQAWAVNWNMYDPCNPPLKVVAEEFRKQIMAREAVTGLSDPGRVLYRSFIEPALYASLEAGIPPIERLIVVPGGGLWNVPFEAFIQDRNPGRRAKDTIRLAEINPLEWPWLVRKFDIGYQYSATVWLEQEAYSRRQYMAREAGQKAKDYVWGREYFPSEGLPRLVNVRKEAEEVQQIFGAKVLLGPWARKSHFLDRARNARIIWLSSHAGDDPYVPENAWISLYPDGPGRKSEKGFLRAYELNSLNLNARLAVLSACETGSGKLVRGEGIISLGRAFANAGCPSIVMSLWNVNDLSGMKILGDFARGLDAGLARDVALSRAKRHYLSKLDSQAGVHPFDWASLVQIGASDPLTYPKGSMRSGDAEGRSTLATRGSEK